MKSVKEQWEKSRQWIVETQYKNHGSVESAVTKKWAAKAYNKDGK